MRFKEHLDRLTSLEQEEDYFNLFDKLSYSLGFSSFTTKTNQSFDTEASLVMVCYVLQRKELKLSRFVTVLVAFLLRYHQLLNPPKLFKMIQALQSNFGGTELPVIQLMNHVLYTSDSKRFRAFQPEKLKVPFYLEPRFKTLIDEALQLEGFFMGLSEDIGLMFPAKAFSSKESDLLPMKSYLQRNEQLRLRYFFGANYRGDAIVLLKKHPDLSVKELSETLMLSYEPAYRLVKELRAYQALGYSL